MATQASVRVSCPECGRTYSVPRKTLAAAATFKCSGCGHAFTTKVPTGPRQATPAYLVRRQGSDENLQPSSLDALKRWIIEGKVSPDDELTKGNGSWTRLADIDELGRYFRVARQQEEYRTGQYLAASGEASGDESDEDEVEVEDSTEGVGPDDDDEDQAADSQTDGRRDRAAGAGSEAKRRQSAPVKDSPPARRASRATVSVEEQGGAGPLVAAILIVVAAIIAALLLFDVI